MSFVRVTKDNVEVFADALGFSSLVKGSELYYFDRKCPIKVTAADNPCEDKCKLAGVAKGANSNFSIGLDICPLWRMYGIWSGRKDVQLMLDDSLLDDEVEDI